MEDKAICLDTTDWKILEALQKNARSTFTEIGQSVGLTAPAVRERIRRMESDELITGYRPVINYAVLGRPIRALIALKFKSGSRGGRDDARAFRVVQWFGGRGKMVVRHRRHGMCARGGRPLYEAARCDA